MNLNSGKTAWWEEHIRDTGGLSFHPSPPLNAVYFCVCVNFVNVYISPLCMATLMAVSCQLQNTCFLSENIKTVYHRIL